MTFRLFSIPVFIQPFFWLSALLIGFLWGHGIVDIGIWAVIVFVAVLIHELGHAVMAKAFGKNPRIELVAFGGLTHHDAGTLSLWKQFLITLNGPLFGFFLYLASDFLVGVIPLRMPLLYAAVGNLGLAALFWTVVNMLPVLPLDGGQLLRIVFEALFGYRGTRYAQLLSFILGSVISVGCFLKGQFIAGIFFSLFAFQSFDLWKRSKSLRGADQNSNLKVKLREAEVALFSGENEKGLSLLQKVREEAGEGMIYVAATQLSAFVRYDNKDEKGAYALLRQIKGDLSPEAICLLHKVAFTEGDYPLVAELSPRCFQLWQTAETALRSAYAYARLSDARSATGWLDAALQRGLENMKEVVREESFDSIRSDPLFISFVKSHS